MNREASLWLAEVGCLDALLCYTTRAVSLNAVLPNVSGVLPADLTKQGTLIIKL